MDYFAGLDISGDETYVCVLERRRRGGSLQQDGVDGRGDRRRIGIDLRPVASMAAICALLPRGQTFSAKRSANCFNFQPRARPDAEAQVGA
jgi:hypothetical protein